MSVGQRIARRVSVFFDHAGPGTLAEVARLRGTFLFLYSLSHLFSS